MTGTIRGWSPHSLSLFPIMNQKTKIFLPLVLASALVPALLAQKEVIVRKSGGNEPSTHVFVAKRGDQETKKESVTFLGVQTAPVDRTLAAQLGLPRETGLVVSEIVGDSPAAAALKEHDVLTRLDDQILVTPHQLGVLIRGKKEGDEVTFAVIRGGKELKVKVKLGQREMPVAAKFEMEFSGPGDGPGHGFQWFSNESPALARLRELPGMGPGEVNDVVRIIGNSRHRFIEGPGVQVLKRPGQGTTILDLPKGNIVYSDDAGSVEVVADGAKRTLTVKDAKGGSLFNGSIATKEERDQLPAEIKNRINQIETANMSMEIGKEFRFEGADIRQSMPPPKKIRLLEPAKSGRWEHRTF